VSEPRAARKRVKKIRLFESPYEYSSSDYSFSLLSAPDEEGIARQATSFQECKDYLQDSIQKHLRNKPFDIYGNYAGSTIIGDTEKLRLLVKYNHGSPEKRMIGTRNFLRLAERELKIAPRTSVTLVSSLFDNEISSTGAPLQGTSRAVVNSKRTVLFTASRAWMKSPTMISLYSLLIRLSHHHKPEEEFFPCLERILAEKSSGTDISYLRKSIDGIRYLAMMGHRRLFGNNKDLLKNYPNLQLHSHGIVHFSQEKNSIIAEKLKERKLGVPKQQEAELGATK
jgi:hypothetical protein